ncbi:MAG: DUF3604 domain-containing protein [Planctomycetota bacterium]
MGKKRIRGPYAGAGEDDRYLRPRGGQCLAPRQIAMCAREGRAWLSWVHYCRGRDRLAVAEHEGRSPSRLVKLAEGAAFGRPALMCRPGGAIEVFCAAGKGGRFRIERFRKGRAGWEHVEGIRCRGGGAYHLDATATGDAGVALAYTAFSEPERGAQLYVRRGEGGRWGAEERLGLRGGFVSRPRLALDGAGRASVIADAYRDGRYAVVWRELDGGEWTEVSRGEEWCLFPSIVRDAGGSLWAAWLREYPVRRGDVMGMWQEARVARRDGCRWKEVGNGAAAALNLGLLPIRRYFGYNGLRRYPRLAASEDGSVWLLWEQQKGEEEIWENVKRGWLCAKRWEGRKWSETVALADDGTCYAVDEKGLHPAGEIVYAVKGEHRASGNDFEVRRASAASSARCALPGRERWRGWKREALPAEPRRKALKGGWKLFWGDLHCHSVFSPDAEGEPDELYHFARDVARLDFACVVDNDFYPDKALLSSEAEELARVARACSREDSFVGLSGFEWTYHRGDRGRSFNHRIVIFPGGERRILRRIEKAGATEKAFRENVERLGYLSIPHHARWRLWGIKDECVVEVTSAWGTYILDAPTVHDALAAGRRFGFVGNSDSHRFLPGLSGALTGVYAEELSREGIITALCQRRCFATTGNRTRMEFRVNDAFMGEETRTKGRPVVRWSVRAQGELERVEVVRDGEVVMRCRHEDGEWTDGGAAAGTHWYYLRAKERGVQRRYPHNVAAAWGKWAWTSPVWVSVERQEG